MSASLWAPGVSVTPPILFNTTVSSQPSPLGNFNSILTAFAGDNSKMSLGIAHSITGASTLQTPSSGYAYTQNAYPENTYLYNSSGYNHSLVSNVGRTAAVAKYIKLDQYGQGDIVGLHVSIFAASNKAGATKFLAQPAGVVVNGQYNAGANYNYANMWESIVNDNGYDISSVGAVYNFNRTNATGAQSNVWLGLRIQSTGTQPINSLISATGKMNNGIDFSMSGLDFGANKAAISLKQNDRIYFNNNALASGSLDADWSTTGYNGDYLTYSSSISGLNVVIAGGSRLQIGSTAVIVNDLPLNVRTANASLTGSIPDRFGPGTIRAVTQGNTNCIIGIAQNNNPPATFGFPTGVTGLGTVTTAGNTAFGGYFEGITYANTGTICGAEIDTFNYGAAATTNFPPDRSIGTLQQSPVALTLGAGGTARSHTALQIVREGSDPNTFLYGLGINADAVTEWGIVIDATSGVGPNIPALIKHKTSAIALQIQGVGTAVAANAAMQVVNATSGTAVFSVRQDGKLTHVASNTQTTVGAAGAASALPANPLGYLRGFIGTTEVVIPYYTLV